MNQSSSSNLNQKLWDIANDLRGNMGADEFRDYILGFIFYKYLSERMHLYAMLLAVKTLARTKQGSIII